MPQAESPKLDYEKRPPVYQRRRWLIVLLVAIVALAGSAWRWGPAVRARIHLLQAQRQCLQYNAPTTQPLHSGTLVPWQRPPLPPPPVCWTDWVSGGRIVNSPTGFVVFLHERKTPSGKRRLIVATEDLDRWGPFPRPTACVYECAGVVGFPKQLWAEDINEEQRELGEATRSGDFVGAFYRNYRIYPAIIDPNDPTHFSIRWEMGRDKGVTDGYLQNDDSVKWESHADR